MTRARKLVLGLALAALLVVAVVFGWQLYRLWTRVPNIATDGGTILVYEIEDSAPDGDYQPDEMVAAVKRRLRSTSADGITVQAVGDRRLEVAVPSRGAAHARDVARVKELLARTGRLEFRIVANADDDPSVFDSVLNNPAEHEQLNAAAASDNVPPAPRPIVGSAFDTDLGSFTYSWGELGREECAAYGLSEDDAGTAEPSSFASELAEARKHHKAVAHSAYGAAFRKNLFYSRPVQRRTGPGKEPTRKYEYFILTRDPERGDEGRARAVTGAYLDEVYPTEDTRRGGMAIGFKFNAEGTARLKELTTKNKERQLALVLDGLIRSAPTVQEPITAGTGIITLGNETKEDGERIIDILRSGALPAPLKPVPVSETTVEPRK